MDDQQDGCGPSARHGVADGDRGTAARPALATGPPPDVPPTMIERLELCMRVAELTAALDTIDTTLRDARAAGIRISERHERIAAGAAAASALLRAIADRLK